MRTTRVLYGSLVMLCCAQVSLAMQRMHIKNESDNTLLLQYDSSWSMGNVNLIGPKETTDIKVDPTSQVRVREFKKVMQKKGTRQKSEAILDGTAQTGFGLTSVGKQKT